MLFLLLAFSGLPLDADALVVSRDLSRLPHVERGNFRYLSASSLQSRDDAPLVSRFWANSLSVRPKITPPKSVSETVYRVDLRDYGWKPESWDWLAKHYPYGDGSYLLRLDWFVAVTSVEPGYSVFLGLGENVKAIQDQFRVREEDVLALRLQTGAAVLHSIVALHNRQLERYPSLSGYWWQTRDVRTNVADQSVLDNVGEKIRSEAGEFIWSLPNGLQAYALAAGDGKKVAEAPIDIAHDTVNGFARSDVRNARSCVGCHEQGIRPIADVVSGLIRAGKVNLNTYEKEKALELEEFYLSDLPRQITEDQERYARAVLKCNGLATAENAKRFISFVKAYVDLPVTPEQAAHELGLSVAEMRAKLGNVKSSTLAALLAGEPIARDAWESVYLLAAGAAW